MDGQWVTYRDIAGRLGISVEAARRRALRGKWARLSGNDGMTRVMPPDDLSERRAPVVRTDAQPDNPVHAQIAKLERELGAALGELVGIREALTESRARTEELSTALAAEREATAKAIAAIAAMAEPLESLAAERARPWWRRLAG